MAWDDDKRAKAISLYTESEPTAENSMEILKEVAEELGESPNGVRAILSKAGVWVKKDAAAAKPATAKAGGTGGTRVSKEASQASLVAAIEAIGQEADMEIISKLTGKAAVYLTTVITAAKGE